MKRPHHPTPEAIELTEGEKDKIMNDFLLPNASVLDFSTKTLDKLVDYHLALSIAYERCDDQGVREALMELGDLVDQATKDLVFEGQQLPWK